VTVRCGRIRYTNALPLYAAIDLGVVAFPGSLHPNVPARLNAMLLEGELDLSPVSAFAWARRADELVLLPEICIGARSEVVSVVLASPLPPARLDGATVYVTPESESGLGLLRVILERRYGVRPAYAIDPQVLRRAQNGQPALLIGDAAIDVLESLPAEHIYDLGRLWHEWAGEDSVFAVWAARRDAYRRDPDGMLACLRALREAYAWWQAHVGETIAAAQATIARPAGFYERYYRTLNYSFDAAAQRGLTAFTRELVAIGAIDTLPAVRPEETHAVAG
jgi:chorismate dehydratase